MRLLLSPIHNHDLWTVTGNYGFKPEMPAQAGTEAVGVVDALGEGVTHLQVGQRVASAGTFGVWSEEFVADAAALIPVADEIPDEVAAQLVSMPFSAISLLDSLDLSEGDWIIQNAANGAVGRLVAQLAKGRGINVVSLVRRAEGVQEPADQGIGRVVATDAEGWKEAVAEITGGAPIRVGVEQVGGQAAGDMLDLLGENSTLVIFGAMASPGSTSAPGRSSSSRRPCAGSGARASPPPWHPRTAPDSWANCSPASPMAPSPCPSRRPSRCPRSPMPWPRTSRPVAPARCC
ncbi:zinc-binding dehydrogenase [Demequina litorisediminis]|uniref:NADPH:quinone reductase n=1 Tax=Demequina litorisediminis TaxID=1849022 RepID=A0ABQ6IJL4_9MICO|nr:hypothetical protein GCM10025876_31260 [Demequina litorisediminis]